METADNLYRALIGLSAIALLLGLVFCLSKLKELNSHQVFLTLMGLVNLISMLFYLFNLEISDKPGLRETVILFDSIILSLNLLLAYFTSKAAINASTPISILIKQLFFFTFISTCIYASAFSIFGGELSLLLVTNDCFTINFTFSCLLFILGSLYPVYSVIKDFLTINALDKNLKIIVILNGVNNFIGLFLLLFSVPSHKVAIMLNMVSNLIFSYFITFYFLSEFFKIKKEEKENRIDGTQFTWNDLRKHLVYWHDLRVFLNDKYPELISKAETYNISDSEKIHYVLKILKIKTKDVANAMNISVKAVEMSRYRLTKKLNMQVKNNL